MTNTRDNIRHYREKAGLNQTELAKILNITQSMMNQMERGTKAVTDAHLATMANLFGVTIDELVNGRCDASGATSTNA